MRTFSKFVSTTCLLGIFTVTQAHSVWALSLSVDQQPIVSTDQSFLQAITRRKTKQPFPRFSMINSNGQIQMERRARKVIRSENLAALNGNGQVATDTKCFNYGEVGFIDGVQSDMRFLRVWVKRPTGWRLFNSIQTPIKSLSGKTPERRRTLHDNPCATVPYTPKTELDKGIFGIRGKKRKEK